jgi:hypothetical protein
MLVAFSPSIPLRLFIYCFSDFAKALPYQNRAIAKSELEEERQPQ